ncbi:MAG: DUF1501 domain-containing protein [Planctomycetota bacterium]|nr:DUF1501 domain-containing protein [Planctomycetota bacterium]
MWTITGETDQKLRNDCDGRTRRSFLQTGVLGGLSLPHFLQMRAQGATEVASVESNRSVVLFWLSGGPGHMETYDPKPNAPSGFRGPFSAISTNQPGVHFGELMPEQARIMDKLAVVRTVNHGSGDHTKGNHWMLTGFEGPAFNAADNTVQRRPAMGSVVARLRRNRTEGLPPYIAVPNLRGGTDNLFHYATYLGGGSNPFIVESDPNDSKYRVRNLTLPGGLSLGRLSERRRILGLVDEARRQNEFLADNLNVYQQKAFDMLTGRSVVEAFDMSRESPTTRDRYGRHTFGQSALLARRLVEAGTPFVTVNCVPWDHHGTAPQMKTEEGANKLIPPMDRAVAALIEDLEARGLFDSTLVVVMGEFGRTPRMNKDAGRDHWGNTFSVTFASGAWNMGQVIGRSSPRGEYVMDRPISPQDVAATVYHFLGIESRSITFEDKSGRPSYVIEKGEPIQELFT